MTTTTHTGPRPEYGAPELAPPAVSAVDITRRYGRDGSAVDALAGHEIRKRACEGSRARFPLPDEDR